MNTATGTRAIEILLVDDSPTDVRLTQEALGECKLIDRLHVVGDGEEAVDFLRQRGRFADSQRPDLVLLDLNLPKKDGRDVLAEIKADDRLRQIPVVVLTTSNDERDIRQAYSLNCNCYITKPVDFEQFLSVVKSIEHFWLAIVALPPSES